VTTESSTQVDEVKEKAFRAITEVLTTLSGEYKDRIEILDLNNALLNSMVTIVGEMIACYPEDEQESVQDWVVGQMFYAQDVMSNVLSLEEDGADDLSLTVLEPRGSC
jgi:hypothetical protein